MRHTVLIVMARIWSNQKRMKLPLFSGQLFQDFAANVIVQAGKLSKELTWVKSMHFTIIHQACTAEVLPKRDYFRQLFVLIAIPPISI